MIAQKAGTRQNVRKPLIPRGEAGLRNSSGNPPKGAIDGRSEINKMGGASRKGMRLRIYKKEGLIQGGNRVYKGSRTIGFLSFLSWPSFPFIP
jgi:hypothetical protein